MILILKYQQKQNKKCKNIYNLFSFVLYVLFGLQIINVELNRGWNSRLGFSLQSNDSNIKQTFVSAIYSDSVAAKDGRLKVGDQILMVSKKIKRKEKTNK